LASCFAKAGSQETAHARRGDQSGPTKVPINERTMTMMYATLALMAGLIAVMFIATAVSSVVNAVRENEAVKASTRRRVAA
jgi:hypothetical protein